MLFTGGHAHHQHAAHAQGLERALATYLKSKGLAVDELRYFPIDKFGVDCAFQIISHRCERVLRC